MLAISVICWASDRDNAVVVTRMGACTGVAQPCAVASGYYDLKCQSGGAGSSLVQGSLGTGQERAGAVATVFACGPFRVSRILLLPMCPAPWPRMFFRKDIQLCLQGGAS